ncbi:MAG: 2-C-methyl-D-erythritol 4-phosphate cytidylyltransferase [Thermodesulfobacteria bacterium]|nr:2-C-methyl-D-erythritol 4-phosphate cytidylyltransferase [Thermodesulfobacteriota bacterium]
MIVAVVPAGGVGKRVGAEIPKQFLSLCGKPIIMWTLEALERTPEIDLIVVAIVSSWQEELARLIAESSLRKVARLVPGGATRQDSVAAALEAVPQEAEIILVHDAARPLVLQETIQGVIRAVKDHGAAIAACPVRDTVKETLRGRVVRTLPRERIFLAQTPQGARAPLLRRAFEKAAREGFQGTDEASLLEWMGVPVYVVPSPATNLKITTPEDLEIAAALLKKRLEEERNLLW